jgi:hypothetical protein
MTGYNHLPAGHPDNPYNYNICGAKMNERRAKERGHPLCQNPAGKGTDHVGLGRCKYHGGKSIMGADHPSFIQGTHSVRGVDKMRQAFKEKARLDDTQENTLDLLGELEVQRHLLYLMLARQAEHHDLDMPMLDEMGQYLPEPKEIEIMLGSENGRESVAPIPMTKLIEYAYSMINDIVKTSTAISHQRKETMLTITEVKYLQSILKETFERFIPDAEQREKAVRWFAERVGQ